MKTSLRQQKIYLKKIQHLAKAKIYLEVYKSRTMKNIYFLFLAILLFSIAANAQPESFDIDSIHYLRFVPEDSINGQLYEVNTMEYLSENERTNEIYYLNNGEKIPWGERLEEINNNGDFIMIENNLADTNLDLDSSYEAIYDGNKLMETIYRVYDNIQGNNQNYETREVFGDFDVFDNPRTIMKYEKLEEEEIKLKNTTSFDYEYEDGNLISSYRETLWNFTNMITDRKLIQYEYNENSQMILKESYDILPDGTKNISEKQEFLYTNDGTLTQTATYFSVSETPDPIDVEFKYYTNYIYQAGNKLFEERFYRLTEEGEYFLRDIIRYYRSRITSTQELEVHPEIISFINLDENYIKLNIDRLNLRNNYSINLFNQIGARIYNSYATQTENWNKELMLPAGIYFLQLVSNNGMRQTKKIVVH